MKKERKTTWICKGDIRGWCGHNHRTEAAAKKCCERDSRNVLRNTWRGSLTQPYSDRTPIETA